MIPFLVALPRSRNSWAIPKEIFGHMVSLTGLNSKQKCPNASLHIFSCSASLCCSFGLLPKPRYLIYCHVADLFLFLDLILHVNLLGFLTFVHVYVCLWIICWNYITTTTLITTTPPPEHLSNLPETKKSIRVSAFLGLSILIKIKLQNLF